MHRRHSAIRHVRDFVSTVTVNYNKHGMCLSFTFQLQLGFLFTFPVSVQVFSDFSLVTRQLTADEGKRKQAQAAPSARAKLVNCHFYIALTHPAGPPISCHPTIVFRIGIEDNIVELKYSTEQ